MGEKEKKKLSIVFHHPVPLPTQTHPCCVTKRKARPTSSFVHPGMWDILTSWLFIDSAQLRVPPVALSLSLSCVCLCMCVCLGCIISVISQTGLTQKERVLGNANQRARGRACGEL